MVARQQGWCIVMQGGFGDKSKKCSVDQAVSLHRRFSSAVAANEGVCLEDSAPELGHSL